MAVTQRHDEDGRRGGGRPVGRALRRLVAASLGMLLAGLTGAVAAPAAYAQPGSYVALGDSYSSGLGTREYIDDGSDCRRSEHAYPSLVAERIGLTLELAACSGAVIDDVVASQLDSLTAGTTDVTISVGGNDAGFADVITQCALPWAASCDSDIDAAETFITDTLPGELDTLYADIRSRAPDAQVVVVGYPRLFNGEECNLAARISAAEQDRLNAAADLLATTIGQQAKAHGFGFVDPRTAFDGHAVCDDVEWINGLSNPTEESFHPNRAGHVGYADLVEPAVRG